MDVLTEAVRLRREGIPAAMATIVRTQGSCPAPVGSRMIVTADGNAVGTVGGGCLDGWVRGLARQVLQDDRIRLESRDLDVEEDSGLICGGTVEVFVEPVTPPRLYIFGAGHIGAALCPIARTLEFHVVVSDDRSKYANAERFPDAQEIRVEWFDAIDALHVPSGAYIVIATRGHQYDERVLRWAVRQPARYIGMVASRKKVERLFASLDPADREKVRAPIGLPIGARTPAEIAVSIAAELVADRRLAGRELEAKVRS